MSRRWHRHQPHVPEGPDARQPAARPAQRTVPRPGPRAQPAEGSLPNRRPKPSGGATAPPSTRARVLVAPRATWHRCAAARPLLPPFAARLEKAVLSRPHRIQRRLQPSSLIVAQHLHTKRTGKPAAGCLTGPSRGSMSWREDAAYPCVRGDARPLMFATGCKGFDPSPCARGDGRVCPGLQVAGRFDPRPCARGDRGSSNGFCQRWKSAPVREPSSCAVAWRYFAAVGSEKIFSEQ